MTRRLCFVTVGLGAGGAERMLWELVTRLPRDQFACSVLSLTSGGMYEERLAAADVPTRSLGLRRGQASLSALRHLGTTVRELRPDVLVGWMYHGCLATLAARYQLGTSPPLVWNVRQSLYSLRSRKPLSAAVIVGLIPAARRASAIVYNSALAARQHERYGYPRHNRHVIANGFDTSRWVPGRGSRGDGLRIGRFGRYTAMKDYDTFLAMAAMIVDKAPHVRFVLAGTDVDGNNTELVGTIARLGLTEHVELLGERSDMEQLTGSLDIAVSSSAFDEGFPNVVGEAMACAVPVVVTDVGASAELVGTLGRVVPPRDPVQLARECLALIALDADERRALGAALRERIVTEFSIERAVEQFADLLGTVH